MGCDFSTRTGSRTRREDDSFTPFPGGRERLLAKACLATLFAWPSFPVFANLPLARPGVAPNKLGLTANPELNQHPALGLPKLTPKVDLANMWFRVERQALVALSETGGILFGIRLEVVPLAKLRENQVARDGLLEALNTMPEEIADYKNLVLARERLIELLC